MCFLCFLHNCLDLVHMFISDSDGITASSEQESGSFEPEYTAVSQLRQAQSRMKSRHTLHSPLLSTHHWKVS